jgi:hypothetical protein
MIPPTVSRFVWYRPAPHDCEPSEHRIPQIADQPLSGQICGVLGLERVNLAVMGADGSGPYPRPNVKLVQDGPVQPGECTWMPFQKGQSMKVDELTDKLRETLNQSNAKLIPGAAAQTAQEPAKNADAPEQAAPTQAAAEPAPANPAPTEQPAPAPDAQPAPGPTE